MSTAKPRKRWLIPLAVVLALGITFAAVRIMPHFYRETLPWHDGLTLGMSPEEAERLLGEATTSEVRDYRSMTGTIQLYENRDLAEGHTLICNYYKFGPRCVLQEVREERSFATEAEAQVCAEATAAQFREAWQGKNLFSDRVTGQRTEISWSCGPTQTTADIAVEGTTVTIRCETNEFFR